MKEPVIFLDTETGGLDPKVNPILTMGLITLDKDGLLKYPEYIRIVPSQGAAIQSAALKKNKLDLVEHTSHPEALTLAGAKQKFSDYYDMVKANTGVKRPRLGGHNVRFDLEMMKEQFYGGSWPRWLPIEGHCLDTMPIIAALIVKGSVPGLEKHSLDSSLEVFGIPTPQAHNAFYDAVSAAKLFKAVMKI